MKELIAIQSELKAPKGQHNNFGNYNYRSAEDILEAVKPLCHKNNCIITLSDEIVLVGDRFYIKATATIKNSSGEQTEVTAYAREEETKKGMDASQITGTASSYARKYALNGLFCIDDTKDADTDEFAKKTGRNAETKGRTAKGKEAAEKMPSEPKELTYRERVIITAKERNITMQELARDYGLDKNTTEERYKEVLEDLEKPETEDAKATQFAEMQEGLPWE